MAQASRPAYASASFWPLGEDRLRGQRFLPTLVLAKTTLEVILLEKQRWPFSMAPVTPGESPDVSQSQGRANTSQQSFLHQGACGSSAGCSAQFLDPTPFLVSLVPGVRLVPGLCPHTSTACHPAWGLVAFAGLGCVPWCGM